ncbi:MAG: hypothetical protein J4F97_04545 [Pseudomonadales bacterium]|nr:hypothetical protein [Pseudomonadales bacterium]
MTTAIALISGGLDSMLAAKLVLDQGVDVKGVNFYTGFCVEGHTQSIRSREAKKPKRNNALWVAEQLGIELELVDVSEEYKRVVLNPKHGYGKNLNPCVDCKIFMLEKLKELREQGRLAFDFMLSGEVLGQRPMSQKRTRLDIIAKESGSEDELLRPLSAKLFPPTLAERRGWVDRESLLGISGRHRGTQFRLAQEFGFEDYAQPAGGCCFLTDPSYASKLSDLWGARGRRTYELEDILLLKVGRHIRPAADFKLIVGRDEGENRFLEGFRRRFPHFKPVSHEGSLVLLDGAATRPNIDLAARIAGRYSQGKDTPEVTISYTSCDGVSEDLCVTPMAMHEVRNDWHLGR